jgi:hypothetical protein
MEKIIDFIFLEKQAAKVNIKQLTKDSEEQQVLICDVTFDDDTTYSDAAFVLGSQPFLLTEEEIAIINS